MLKMIPFIKSYFVYKNIPLQSESDVILVNEMTGNKGI